MQNVPLVTRAVQCPRCRADATLSYTAAAGRSGEGCARRVVFLCSNVCTLSPDEVTAMLNVAIQHRA
jgi:hypothetical protein